MLLFGYVHRRCALRVLRSIVATSTFLDDFALTQNLI